VTGYGGHEGVGDRGQICTARNIGVDMVTRDRALNARLCSGIAVWTIGF
jgi:hypothetical protein